MEAGRVSARPRIAFTTVWHRRLRPVDHGFRYGAFFLLLPLRSMGAGAQPRGLLSRNRPGWMSFHDRDHGDGRSDCLQWFDEILRGEGITDATGEVWLQTMPRLLGFVFNPVSFWYAYRADGTTAAILAEVNNTFGERHCYLLTGDGLERGGEARADKVFHVSPFCHVAGEYRFRFHGRPGEEVGLRELLRVQVDLHDAAGPLLRTGIAGSLRELDARSRRRALRAMPFLTFGVVARIHLQAIRLLARRVPFLRKPVPPQAFVTR